VAEAMAAAAAGSKKPITTYDVSVDEPVSQLTFYRMVQAAVARRHGAAACFKIEFGRSLLGRVSAFLYTAAVGMGAKVVLMFGVTCASVSACVHLWSSCRKILWLRVSSAASRTTTGACSFGVSPSQ
jgi:hypothetical protein